jgi:hypothetical protein
MELIFENATKSLYPKLALFAALAEFKDVHQRRPPLPTKHMRREEILWIHLPIYVTSKEEGKR